MSTYPIASGGLPRESRIARAIYLGCAVVFLTALGGWALLAHQDSPVARRLMAQEQAALADQQLAYRLVQLEVAEIRLSELARSRAASAEVKGYAETILREHTRALSELRNAAAKGGATLPQSEAQAYEEPRKQLAGLNGSDFDRAYARDIVQIDEDRSELLQSEGTSARGAELRNYEIKVTLAASEELSQARELAARLDR